MVQGSMYDPFDTDTIGSTWTVLGAPTAHDIDSTIPGQYYISEAAAAGVSLNGIFKPWNPSTNGDYVETLLTDCTAITGNYIAGLIIGEAAGTAKILSLHLNFGDTLWQPAISSFRYTNRTTFNAGNFGPQGINSMTPLGLRIKRETSSTVFQAYLSWNGRLWSKIGASFDPSMTIAVAGLFVDTNSASGVGIEASFEYFNGIQGGA